MKTTMSKCKNSFMSLIICNWKKMCFIKKNGIFITIERTAKHDSGYDITNTLQRIDLNIVKFQLEKSTHYTLPQNNG